MSLFKKIYDKSLYYAGHSKATHFICGYSFFEAIILPIPLDVFLGPIAMKNPKKWFLIAVLSTVFSILGGLVGYAIGYFISDWAEKFVNFIAHPGIYQEISGYIDKYGNFLIILVGFTPLPFKIFAIVFGMAGVNIPLFIILSFISRLTRFCIVAFLFAHFGNKYQHVIEKVVTRAGWLILIVCLLGLGAYILLT